MTLLITITTRTAITRIRSNQLQRAFNSDATGPLRFAKRVPNLSDTLTRLCSLTESDVKLEEQVERVVLNAL